MSTDEYSKQFYAKNAQKYTDHVRDPKDSVYHAYYEKPAMYALLPDLLGKVVLSVGCGSGEDSIYLKNQGADRSVGIDLTKELIDIAKESYSECEFHVMNMEQLEFPSESFDFVYSSLAIHYVEDWENVFKRIYTVLKPKSYFLFSCGNPVRFAMDRTASEEYFIQKLEVSMNKVTKEFNFTRDYMSTRKIVDALGKNTANTWTRPFSNIAAMIHSAGFMIEQIIEPRPLETLMKIDSNTYQKLSKVPEFVIFKLFKN